MFMLKIQTLSVLKGIAKIELTFGLCMCIESFILNHHLLCKFHIIIQDLSNKKGYFAPSEFTTDISLGRTYLYFDKIINQQI